MTFNPRVSLAGLAWVLVAACSDDKAPAPQPGSTADNFESLQIDDWSYFAGGTLTGMVEHDAVWTKSTTATEGCSVAADPADVAALAAQATAPEVLAALATPGVCHDTVDGAEAMTLRLHDGRILGVQDVYGCPDDSPLVPLAGAAVAVVQKYCYWGFASPDGGQ